MIHANFVINHAKHASIVVDLIVFNVLIVIMNKMENVPKLVLILNVFFIFENFLFSFLFLKLFLNF